MFVALLIVKIISAAVLSQYDLRLGGGNDADYYHSYAIGQPDIATSIWPSILRSLNGLGLYERRWISCFLMVLGFLVIPLTAARLAVSGGLDQHKTFWLVVVALSLYPTLYYYTLDIYRDVFMVFCFLAGAAFVRTFLSCPTPAGRWISFLLAMCVCWLLFLLRPYLGFAFFVAVMLLPVYSFKKWRLAITVGGYIGLVFMVFSFGGFDDLLVYRQRFSNDLSGGSNLGIVFNSTAWFVPNFIRSGVVQLLGLHFTNDFAVLIFFVESVPFFFGVVYLLKNRRYADRFVSFLVSFSVVYMTVWIVGNDNLGTAIRLRLLNYIALLLAVAVVYIQKQSRDR